MNLRHVSIASLLALHVAAAASAAEIMSPTMQITEMHVYQSNDVLVETAISVGAGCADDRHIVIPAGEPYSRTAVAMMMTAVASRSPVRIWTQGCNGDGRPRAYHFELRNGG